MVQGSQATSALHTPLTTRGLCSVAVSQVHVLNCAEVLYKMNGGGSGGGSESYAGLNTGHYGKGEGGGRTGDCCKDSGDCYSSCRSG